MLPAELVTPKREVRLGRTEIPRRYWDLHPDLLDSTPLLEDVRDWTDAYLVGELVDPARGLILTGNPGVGKTTALCIAGVAIQESRRSRVRYITMADYVRRQIQLIRLEPRVRARDADAVAECTRLESYFNSLYTDIEVLILDDLGKEHSTSSGFNRDEFDYLLRTRWSHRRTTLITTNLRPGSWKSCYGPSMEDFLHEATNVVEFRGESRRVRG